MVVDAVVGVSVDLTRVMQTAGVLREARSGEDFVLSAPEVVEGLVQVLPAADVSLVDLDLQARRSHNSALLPVDRQEDISDEVFWEHFWDTKIACYTERVPRLRGQVMTTADFYSDRQWHSTGMYTDFQHLRGLERALCIPLPGPPGIARRLVFFREPGLPFGENERDAAVILQPHVTDALRYQVRQAARRLITARQAELLGLVAAGHDNIAIARLVRISPATVRKHLENAYTRLEVTSRTAAIAKYCPDVTWR
jgi:DNA-binding CsgD family transcriptional regulator